MAVSLVLSLCPAHCCPASPQMEAVSCYFLVGFGGKQVLKYIFRQHTLANSSQGLNIWRNQFWSKTWGSTLSHCSPWASKLSAEKRRSSSSKVLCYALSFQFRAVLPLSCWEDTHSKCESLCKRLWRMYRDNYLVFTAPSAWKERGCISNQIFRLQPR